MEIWENRLLDIKFNNTFLLWTVFNLYFLLSWSEWILLFEIEISESVIDLSVVGFVRPDGQDDVPHESSISKFPVVLGDDRGRKAAPHWQFALVDLVNDVGVGNDGLLLQVSHEPDVVSEEMWGRARDEYLWQNRGEIR